VPGRTALLSGIFGEQMERYRPTRKWFLAIALLAGGLAAGCGGSHKPTAASSTAAQATAGTSPATTSSTSTTHKPATKPSSGSTKHTSGSSKNAAVTTPSAPHKNSSRATQKRSSHPPLIPAGPLLRAFAGTGNTSIGTLSEKSTVVLEWTTTKPPIQIFTSRGFLIISSHTRSGGVRLAHGRFPGVHVATKGQWTIQLHAQ
jgi:hypothetical protein